MMMKRNGILSILVATTIFAATNAGATLRGSDVGGSQVDERELFESRIIGGSNANKGEFPFYVKLEGCGATLIHEDIILTAAHCKSVSNNMVTVGAYSNSFVNYFTNTYRFMTTRRVHPNFNSKTLAYDYMVIKLNSKVSNTPVVLNTNPSIPTTNALLTVIGFGVTTSGGSGSSTLLKVNVTYVDSTTCGSQLGETISPTLELCAGVPGGGKDSCQGDSGGPIMDAITKQQVGIVSYGVGCGQANRPGVYSRVTGALGWINQQICELSSNPPSSCKSGSTPTTTTPRPTAAPVSSPSPKPVSCFSEKNTIQVDKKGPVSITNLQIGDKVMDASGKMVTVYSFGHFQENIKAEYLQIHSKKLSQPLEISGDHLLFVSGTAVPASTLQIGDQIDLGYGMGNARVHKIGNVTRSAAFAPFTTSGTIMVSGVAASSYVTIQPGSDYLRVGDYQTPLSMHWLAHVSQTPHRLICEWNINLCKSETYTSDGISRWVEVPFYIGTKILENKGWMVPVLLIPSLSLGLVMHALETAFSNLWTMTVVASVSFLILGFFRARKVKSKVL